VTQLAVAVAGIQVRMLGPLRVAVDGVEVEIRGRRPRTLLAVLALSAGQPVSVDALIDRLWNQADLPSNPRASLQTYVLRVRQALGRDAISTVSGQYTLNIAPAQVDALRFQRLLASAEADGHNTPAALQDALSLWLGTPFDEPLSDWLTEQAAPQLVEAYLGALERRAEHDLAAGRAADSLGELQEQAARFPLRESLWAALLTALAASGRPAEAIDAYDAMRRRLADELGVDPSPRLQQIHADLLAGTDTPRPSAAGRAVPQQLPADPRAFTGRSDALARLDALASRGDQGAAPVIVVHGPGGIGKTTLAIRWAGQVRDQYPDGQLFVDLRGFSPSSPMTPEQALAALLGGMGITADRIPAGVEAASALWRTTLAGRRALVVLDNARDAQQVRPLLPGPESTVVITSRSQLRGLVARDGATQVPLDRLDPAESTAFLRARLEAKSVDRDARLGELAELCEGHPLALAIAAERCGRLPDRSLDDMVVELRGEAARLDALNNGEDPASDLRAVFSWSYRALDEDTARVYRLLGLHPGGGISLLAVAALAGITCSEARRLVDRLVEANLLRPICSGRFALLDLLHEYAAEQAASALSAGERGHAIRRLVSWYLHSVVNANIALTGRDPRLVAVGDPDPQVVPRSFDDDRDALAWLDTEWAALSLVVPLAIVAGERRAAYRLVTKLFSYLLHRRPPSEATELQTMALDSADRVGAAADAAFLRNQRGTSWARLGEAEKARCDFVEALDVFRRLHHAAGEKTAVNNLAQLDASLGNYDQALTWFDQGIVLAESTDAADNLGTALAALANTYLRMGRGAQAVQAAGQAVALTAAQGSADEYAYALSLLGGTEAALGQYGDAEAHLRQALQHQQPAGTWAAAITLRRLGTVALQTGRHELARSSWRDALAIVDETGILDATELSRDELVGDLDGLVSRPPA
jgi:DNA-binding SARP family transcriptional activator/Flp pilus assembly protein TadD